MSLEVFSKRANQAQSSWAQSRLASPDADSFVSVLSKEFTNTFSLAEPLRTPDEIVSFFLNASPQKVQKLFIVVRRALRALPASTLYNLSIRRKSQEAAAALYFLAACRLVDVEAKRACLAVPGSAYVLRLARCERLICAVIANALFGGQLRFASNEGLGPPVPDYVFEVRVPESGDELEGAFLRAVYNVVFENDRGETKRSIGSGPLSKEESARLKARLNTYKNVTDDTVALVVRGLGDGYSVRDFADKHEVPVMLESSEVTTAILGMDVDELLAEISEFWRELQALPGTVSPVHTRPSSQSQKEGEMMDPISVIAAIGAALGLIDKFVGLVRTLRSSENRPPSVEAKQEKDALVIRRNGEVVETVTKQQLNLNEWDEARFNALHQRVDSLWKQFNGLYAALPNLGVDEKVRIQQNMENQRKELCKDFAEMIKISEKVLGVPLADHYTLYDICNNH